MNGIGTIPLRRRGIPNPISKRVPAVLVSFARSGNSPESVATVQLAQDLADELLSDHHYMCRRRENWLASYGMSAISCFFNPKTNDAGFAMTSSLPHALDKSLGALVKRGGRDQGKQ